MTFDKKKVVYQIYPKSFKDTTGNGIGDLNGIIEKLPYLKELGVDVLWLNPFYPSPQRDNGYDVADYKAINPLFGTMEDFDRLVSIAKKYHMELMLDMVLNHCSTDHEWFQKALQGDKKYQDYFILRKETTDWQSKFGGLAWSKFGNTDYYYLHLFDKTQADLNWRNPEVRLEMQKVVNFWREKGIKHFRFDVINLIGKDQVLKSNPVLDGKMEYTDKPITHKYLKELNLATFGQDSDSMTVGEMSSTTIENCIKYSSPNSNELAMVFNFHHLKVDYENGQKWTLTKFDFKELQKLYHDWGNAMSHADGWNALFWNNHDQPRALNRFINIKDFHEEGATMLAASIHLSRGTPYIYMGEEIGMLDPNFDDISDYVDVESHNAFENLLSKEYNKDLAFKIIKAKSRDNSRTPMQWDESENAGFTTATPWLKVAETYPTINVERCKNNKIFKFYQQLIKLRKDLDIISHGSYKSKFENSDTVYAFEREYQGQKLLVLNNFFDKETNIEIDSEFTDGKLLLSNYEDSKITKQLSLRPYESIAIII
ncbi:MULTISPECIES: alpha,alpha-phosphotrehalase [unclassified Gemella]|uniref:alpha,alpha-phosphotrehalase n=1 Tax=unclassified Gemella TaxID=2624949 RepID=UPI0015CFC080|nr:MULTISPECIES: alpha,alpha-phosphotrehalase [unclassified Gemella]MBF0710652.1 alpha,alpha-phosphotrehalase [Gemella sp. GL1.1]NYS27996.1 alpha,alpha-phosphotrehalase [Gemella sp. GL1]